MFVLETQYSLDFGPAGDGATHAAVGASQPEHYSESAVDAAGKLELPAPSGSGNYVLLVSLTSETSDSDARRLVIKVGGQTIHDSQIRFPTVLAAPLSWPAASSAPSMEVVFEQAHVSTQSWSPGSRERGLAISNVVLLRVFETKHAEEPERQKSPNAETLNHELPAEALMQRFASFGDNCEFGVVQRRFNAEPMDLFRFARVSLHTLERMLINNFAGLDAPENIKLELRETAIGKREFIFCHKFYDEFESHPWIFEGEQPGHRVFVREQRRVSLLLRLMRDDIRQGSRILVLKRNSDTRLEDVMPVFRLLRSYGPNWLLWVGRSSEEVAPGTVDLLEQGLMRAYIDEFAPYNDVHDRNAEVWLTICRRAYELWRASRLSDAPLRARLA